MQGLFIAVVDIFLLIDNHLCMSSSNKKKQCTQCFGVLADKTRILLLRKLKNASGGVTVTSLTRYLGVTQPTVSHHLKLLSAIGLAAGVKKGRETLYRFNDNYPCSKCGVF